MPTIEQNLERIADALEKIAAQGGSISVVHNAVGAVSETKVDVKAEAPKETKQVEKPADKPKEPEKPKSTKTKDDVRKALQAYREIEGTPAMLEVLKKHGASNLNELAEDQYDAVVAAVS